MKIFFGKKLDEDFNYTCMRERGERGEREQIVGLTYDQFRL